jgi:hypothetical protein
MVMTFRKATDELLIGISHEELAKALSVSVATVRQARLTVDAKAHRSPPEGWESVILRMAKQRADHYRRLVGRLEGL